MAEPPEFSARAHRHIPIDLWRETTAYAFPARNMRSKPKRDNYAAHAAALTQALAQALPPIPPRHQDPRVPIAGLASGAIIVMETRPLPERSTAKASKVPAGFDFATQDIVVLRSERRDDRTESAVVFVPDGARNFLSGRIAAYGRDPVGRDRPDQARFEVVERFVAAEALALFAEPLVRGGPAVWWEYWIRAAPGRADVVAQTAAQRGHDVHPDRLNFPDTTVLLVHASADHALALAEATVGAVTEVRRSTETILPFLDRGDDRVGQADFVADLAARVTAAPRDAPFVCLMDTGVAAAHPLIAPGLAGALAYDEAWGVHDHADGGGHGTGLATLALYGDLHGPMQDLRAVALGHAVVSMKLLAPRGFAPHEPRRYGFVTQGAVAQVEIAHGQAAAYLLATGSQEHSAARPSSWSGALDQIASGSTLGDIGDGLAAASARPKRLLAVATGNVTGGMKADIDPPGPIEDPAQSWNALTIGGYTTKVEPGPDDIGMTPVALANALSPFSRTSGVLPGDLTPIKPEVLFEAGNMLADRSGFCGYRPSVSLLCAGSDVVREPLTPIWATSAATGVAGQFFGRLEAALPGLWPETYRGLTVQSADWPAPMRKQLIGKGAHWKTGPKGKKQTIIRSFGYGVPSLDRAVASARNAVTLIAQAEIQPFAAAQEGRGAVYNEMHFYNLPWPTRALEALENEIVVMKVALSYFIEPNLTGRAATRPDTYRSFGLRFGMKRRGETDVQFRARVNAAQQKETAADKEADHWLLGPMAVNVGSLHCDLWRGRAIELAGHDAIAIYPVGGWWKSHQGQRRMNDKGRYSLTITLSASGHEVDMHSEIETLLEAKVAATLLGVAAEA